MKDGIIKSSEYRQFISELKARVSSARISAARAVNRDVILRLLCAQLAQYEAVLRCLSDSAIWRQAVAKLGSSGKQGTARVSLQEVRQVVAEVPWGQNLVILH
jgi:hypothetical protein